MKTLALATAALAAAVVVFVSLTIAPRRIALVPFDDGTVSGILHIHSNRSDGLSGPDEIAAAARRAGLKFVVFTDHGDATRVPDPPQYRSGVLCIDAVEISTTGGHYVAIGMPASPYPLGGEPRDVVEDVRRLGGFGIVAHPDSPKPQLQWSDWDVPFDGIEILNLDTIWRVWVQEATTAWSARRKLFSAIVDYPFRSPETIASLIPSSSGITERWTMLAAQRRIVTIAGADAHSKLGLRGDPADTRWVLPLPGYEESFRTMSVPVTPRRALSGNADADAATVLDAIRNGHLHTTVDAIATPASLEFTASNGSGTAHEGDQLTAAGPVILHVRTNAPSGFTTNVWRGGSVFGPGHHESDFTLVGPGDPAIYWVEIRSTGRTPQVAWLTSNPIYVRDSKTPASVATRAPAARVQSMFDDKSTSGWRTEHDPTSVAAVDAATLGTGGELRFRFGLAGGSLVGQVAALVFDTPAGVAGYDRVACTTRAEKPMRISVQLRAQNGDRWQRSIYVDTTDQERVVSFGDVTAVGTAPVRPPLADIRSVMFVVDTTNTRPGTSARIWIKRPELQK